MSALLAGILGGAALALATFYVATRALTTGDLSRAVKAGVVDPTPFGPLREFDLTALGANPDGHYLYGCYALRSGEEAVVVFPTPQAKYFAITLYDLLFQALPAGNVPTHLNHRTLSADADGQIRVILGFGEGAGQRLDVSGAPRGVVLIRVFGGEPEKGGTLEKCRN